MEINGTPLFRQIIIPYHDSEAACLLTIICMDLVFLFSAAGVGVAMEIQAYQAYIWVPVALIVMSGGVIVSITIRLIYRYADWLKRKSG